MNIFRLYVLFGLQLVAVGVGGCTDSGATAIRQPDPSDVSRLIAEAEAIQQSTIDDIYSEPTPTTLVSTTSADHEVQPSLITLPRGGDLLSQIDRAGGPVLLDFFADWCGPCRTQSQILKDMKGTAAASGTLIIKINVDEHPRIAEQLRISSLPTLMMIKGGRIVRRQTGVADKSRLVTWMQ